MVGGKVGLGEHIQEAAIREVKEETGATEVTEYSYRGFVTERLVQPDGNLSAHFLIFVNHAKIADFQTGHREGDLALFSIEEIESRQEEFLPSDWFMFKAFRLPTSSAQMFEAELVQDPTGYKLNYYRKVSD
jgi:8-oxo-dGTP pyrophosphatase MutT (NUDIX family)